jgi:hypothetical protein
MMVGLSAILQGLYLFADSYQFSFQFPLVVKPHHLHNIVHHPLHLQGYERIVF